MRLKTGKNTSCYNAFLDKTRNSSGLYRSSAGSAQMSMRAHRNRLKGTTG